MCAVSGNMHTHILARYHHSSDHKFYKENNVIFSLLYQPAETEYSLKMRPSAHSEHIKETGDGP